MDTCEKTPCRYIPALLAHASGIRGLQIISVIGDLTWGPGQMLALELQSLLTSIYVPAHVFPSLVGDYHRLLLKWGPILLQFSVKCTLLQLQISQRV